MSSGSSGVTSHRHPDPSWVIVQPASSLPIVAYQNGVDLVEININKTPITPYASFVFSGQSGEVIPNLITAVSKTESSNNVDINERINYEEI